MRKEIAFLLFCLGVLAFFLYLTLHEGRWIPGNSVSSDASESVLFAKPVTAQDVAKIELRRPGDIVTFARQKDGSWRMINPIEAKPDAEKLNAILSLVVAKEDSHKLRIPIGKETAAQSAALEAFGMGTPKIGVVYTGEFGERSLWLGESAPQDQGVYARWARDRFIELMSSAICDILSAPVRDLREHKILHDPQAPIATVNLRTRSEALQLLEDGKAVLTLQPGAASPTEIAHQADPARRKEIFEFLENLSCQDFLDSPVQVLSGETLLTIRLTRRGSRVEETWTLQKLSTVGGEQWVLSKGEGQPLCTVVPEAFTAYLADLSWALDYRWTDLKAADCNWITIRSAHTSAKLFRSDGVWTLPGFPQWRSDPGKIEDFLKRLFAVHSAKLVPCQELPVREIQEIEVGRSADDAISLQFQKADGQWILHRKGDSFAFVVADPGLEFAVAADNLHWRDAMVLDMAPGKVSTLALIRPGIQIHFVRKGAEWNLLKPRSGKADAKTLDAALKSLLPLRAIRFLNPKETRNAGAFALRLEMKIGGQEKGQGLMLGQAVRGGVLAKLSGDSSLFVVSKDSVEMFLKDPIVFVSVLEEDTNRNGKIDQRIHYVNGRRSWMESDDDEDGKVDTKTFWRYNQQGDLIRIDADTNNDGIVDQRTYLRDGVPYRQEDDTSGSGHVDVWTTFVKGVQARQRLDSDGDGKPDLFKNLRRGPDGEIIGAQVHQTLPAVSDYAERYEGGKVLRDALPKGAAK